VAPGAAPADKQSLLTRKVVDAASSSGNGACTAEVAGCDDRVDRR
jgi:hypothetical protein